MVICLCLVKYFTSGDDPRYETGKEKNIEDVPFQADSNRQSVRTCSGRKLRGKRDHSGF